jgi:hypothetical protein
MRRSRHNQTRFDPQPVRIFTRKRFVWIVTSLPATCNPSGSLLVPQFYSIASWAARSTRVRYFTSVTGTSTRCSTCVVTEPRSRPRTPPNPLVPMMMCVTVSSRAK